MINNEKIIAELERAMELNAPIVVHSVEEAHQMCEILDSFDAADSCQVVRQNALKQKNLPGCEVFCYIRVALRNEDGKFNFMYGSTLTAMRRYGSTPMDFSEFLRRVREETIPLSEYLFEEEQCT